MAMDTENTTRNSVATSCRAASVPLTNGANSLISTAPAAKNQLMPRIASQAPDPCRAVRSTSAVALNTFHSIRWSPRIAGAAGTARLAKQPTTATPTAINPASHGGTIPASNCPPRMARKVPLSISPVPPMISFGRRCWGMIAYLIGPNRVECSPIRNRLSSRTGIDPAQNPPSAMAMMATSASLIQRTIRALSIMSANCPASAENRK